MEKNNLMSFFLVATTVGENEIKLLKLNPTVNGWYQSCSNDRAHFREYVSKETLTDLLDWFKLEFCQYRIFQNERDAMEYADEKMKASNLP